MRLVVFFFKQKTAYEMRISDWSSDVCSSDLLRFAFRFRLAVLLVDQVDDLRRGREAHGSIDPNPGHTGVADGLLQFHGRELLVERCFHAIRDQLVVADRSEEHTYELQHLMRILFVGVGVEKIRHPNSKSYEI